MLHKPLMSTTQEQVQAHCTSAQVVQVTSSARIRNSTGEDVARLLQKHSATAAAAELVGKCKDLSPSEPGERRNRLVFAFESDVSAIERKGARGPLWEGAKKSRVMGFQS